MLSAAQSVLGSLLIKPAWALPIIRRKVSPEDFLFEHDRAIYEAACKLADDGEVVDIVPIQRMTEEAGMSVSGAYLLELMEATPTAANAELYCRELIIESARNGLREILTTSLEKLDNKGSMHEICAQLRDETADMSKRIASGGLTTSTTALINFRDYRSDLESGKRTPALKTGYDKLDSLLGGGLVSEGLYILAARPGGGKTTFALNIAERAAARGIPVLFISLEMSEPQITAKRLAIETGISSTALLNDAHPDAERGRKIYQASVILSDRPLFFNNAKSASVAGIRKLAMQIGGLGLVVIDYLGLLEHKDGKSLYEKITATSGELKRFARACGMPVLCLAQLNRESEVGKGEEPKMSHLRDSGAIEQDADGIILLHKYDMAQEDETSPASIKLILAKNRHGGMGSINMNFYLKNGRIRE